MAFATTADLVEYIPDITNHGVGDFTDQLNKAQVDIEKMVKVRWFDKAYQTSSLYRLTHIGTTWDATKLDQTQWTKCTVYRALSSYIFPMLSNFRPEGDAFREQISFYAEKFEQELSLEFEFGIRYDTNNDDSFSVSETHEFAQDRMYR